MRALVPNVWNTVTLTPCDDIAALWPDLPPQDFASWRLNLNAVSTGGLARGFFDYLRFGRRYTSGDVPLQTQQSIGAAYASKYPNVAQRQGLEISLFNPHLNWFGGAVSLPDYTGITSPDSYLELMKDQVSAVHGAGGDRLGPRRVDVLHEHRGAASPRHGWAGYRRGHHTSAE